MRAVVDQCHVVESNKVEMFDGPASPEPSDPASPNPDCEKHLKESCKLFLLGVFCLSRFLQHILRLLYCQIVVPPGAFLKLARHDCLSRLLRYHASPYPPIHVEFRPGKKAPTKSVLFGQVALKAVTGKTAR